MKRKIELRSFMRKPLDKFSYRVNNKLTIN